jgi:protein TonB
VVDVKAIAQHQSLIKEASRVISKLPKMTPGKQGNTNVDVIYRVPIRFNID